MNVVKFSIPMLVITLKYHLLKLKSMIKLNLRTLDFKNDFKNGLHLQTCKYRPLKVS